MREGEASTADVRMAVDKGDSPASQQHRSRVRKIFTDVRGEREEADQADGLSQVRDRIVRCEAEQFSRASRKAFGFLDRSRRDLLLGCSVESQRAIGERVDELDVLSK